MDREGGYIKNSTVASKPQVLLKPFHLVEGFLLFYFSLFTLNFTNLELHAYRIRIRSTREEASKYFFSDQGVSAEERSKNVNIPDTTTQLKLSHFFIHDTLKIKEQDLSHAAVTVVA